MDGFIVFMQKNWAWLLSFSTVVGGLVVYVYSRIKALQLGVQALLRAQMIMYYNQYRHGSVPLYVRDSFENCWIQYEKLGANGIMEDTRKKFLELPISEEA